jgi:hypothetical protein
MGKQIKYELIVSELAEEEIKASKDFYNEQKAGLGNEFLTELEKIIERITKTPKQFPKIKNKQVRKAHLARFPFSVLFATKGLIINVLAVFHYSRNPKKLNKRF